MAGPPSPAADPIALFAARRAAHAERQQVAQARWTRFQTANRRRYAHLAGARPSAGLARLLARAKTPGRVMLLSGSGLWQPGLDESVGSIPGPTVPLTDYVRAGPDPAVQPRALFDQSWYLANAPALAGSRWPPLAHYLVVGDSHGLSPHPLVDGRAYRGRFGAQMAARRLTALEHFLFEGAAQGADPHPLFDTRYYVGQSEDLADSGENPLIHYLRTGWRNGLEPHPLFAGAWYAEQNPQVADSGVAPLLHYLTVGADLGLDPHPMIETARIRRTRAGDGLGDFLHRGARELRSPSSHFHPAYYLEQEGGSPEARANPLRHYLTEGAFQGLWPSPDFDEIGYFAAHPEAASSPLSGLEHWRLARTTLPPPGAVAGPIVSAAALFADLRRAADPDPEAYDISAFAALRRPLRHPAPDPHVRTIAFRRTRAPDWTAVSRALPNYRGHLQPRWPEGGFTDPADPKSLSHDVRLAERYGLSGFCQEVELAADVGAILARGAPAFPFCVAWTGSDDPASAIAVLAPALAAGQAIRIDDRPVLVAPATIDPTAWRAAAGSTGLFLIQRGGAPRPGFDDRLEDIAAGRSPEGPPGPVINPDFRGHAHHARALVAEAIAGMGDGLPLVTAAHDTTPVNQNAPTIWHGASPGVLQAWLQAARDHVGDRPPERRLVFIHAWNDWQTGAALSPDRRFGHGWLEAVANAADAGLLVDPEGPHDDA